MSFFVSEKMSKASKPIRQAMLKPSSSISNVLTPLMRRDLRQIALVINAVPKGILTPKYSTAALIPGLNAIDKQGLTTPRNRLGAAKGQAHNPLWFYSAISQLLLPDDFQILKCDLTKQCSVPHDTLESAIMAGEVYNGQSNSQNIEVIMIEAGQETAHSKPRKQLLELISGEKSFKARGRDWVLDSVAMLDTTNSHFGGVITCNGKPHTFDGITGSRLHQKSSWKTIVELFKGVGRKIPTPSPEDFEYNIHTGYSVFAFVPKN